MLVYQWRIKTEIHASRTNTSSNFADVNNLEVGKNTGASKTVSFTSTVSEIDFEQTNLTIKDFEPGPVPVTSRTPMWNQEKPEIDIVEYTYNLYAWFDLSFWSVIMRIYPFTTLSEANKDVNI